MSHRTFLINRYIYIYIYIYIYTHTYIYIYIYICIVYTLDQKFENGKNSFAEVFKIYTYINTNLKIILYELSNAYIGCLNWLLKC